MTVTQRWGLTIPLAGVPLMDHKEWFVEMEALGFTDVWSAETNAYDAFTPLTLAAVWAPSLRLGQAIVPVYTRGPALLAQSIATLADGLTYASICRLQARYRTIYAIIGLVILLNLWGGSHVT